MSALADAELSRWILAIALIAARLIPVFALVPFFGGRLVPAPVRIGFALAFAALMAPALGAAVTGAWVAEAGPVLVVVLLVKEVLVGAALGFVAAMPFAAADAAGRLVDVARGAQQSQVLIPQTGEQSTPLGNFSLQLAVVIFLLIDGHLLFFGALAASYEALPVLATPTTAGWGGAATVAIESSAAMIAAAIGLAAPALAAAFLADLALGLINRVAPQVQVYFVGMPVKAVVGVLAFMLALGGMATVLAGDTLGGVEGVRDTFRVLGR